ncbi:response regulator transcription factor [Thiobacter aerophilum]|uniref:Response regulator transcription factor n=1 Tax=Thiobacter aerophilum TaxID=3121275 RepID=A0ABV0ED82_9BURK
MRILLADDHSLFREGLLHVLKELGTEPDVVQAADYPGALEVAERNPDLDLALLDLNMPGLDGLTGVRTFRGRFPLIPVIVLSASESPEDVRQALEAGVLGYIPKSSTAQVMLSAIKLVLAGGVYLPTLLLAHEGVTQASPPPRQTSVTGRRGTRGLTERQLQVLALLAEGKPNKVIARTLDITEGTVKIHLAAIFQTLGVRNRTEAVIAAQEMDLAPYRLTG